MDTDYIFLSYVGTQKWGTLNPLMALLTKEQKVKYPLSKIVLMYTGRTVNSADEIKKELDAQRKLEPSIPEVELYETNYHDLVFEHFLEDLPSKIIYNIDGGMNFNTAFAVNTLYKTDSFMISTCKEKAYLFDLKNFSNKKIPLSKPKSVSFILKEQGLELVPNSNPSPLCEFIKAKKIKLLQGTEQNKILNGIPCDLIWNDGSNRLVFVSSVVDVDNGKNNRELLERVRDLAFVGASKTLTKDLYDRTWYALCSRPADIEHINEESRGKAYALDIFGKFDNNGEFVSPDGSKNLSKLLAFRLKDIFNGEFNKSERTDNVEKYQVKSDTLIIAVGTDITNTVNAIFAHKKMHNIKNVVLLASNYENVLTLRDGIMNSPKLNKDLDFATIVSDINASTITKNLTLKEDATNVHVNITPGTKGQCAALTFWAKKRGAGIWSINHSDIASILDPNDESGVGMYKSVDILTILSCKYDSVTDEEENFDHEGYHELYKFMKECFVAIQKNPNHYFRKPHEDKPFELAGYTLEIVDVVNNYYDNEQSGKLKLTTPENKIFLLPYKGGDWFENLVAQSFIEAGFSDVHSQVKINNQSGDKDVICGFKSVNCLISCKAQKIGTKDANPLDETVNEANNMAKHLNRFALSAVCYLEKDKEERVRYPQKDLDEVNEQQKIKAALVFGWKDLCDPEGMKEKFEKFLDEQRTAK